MKKLITFLFAFLFILAPVWGQRGKNAGLEKSILQRILLMQDLYEAETQVVANSITDPQEKRTFLLNQETDFNLWKTLTWKDFLRLNEEAKKQDLTTVRKEIKQQEQWLKEYPNVIEPVFTIHNSAPDYAHAFTHKYVFISESISHDTNSAPQEAINILKAARKARPNDKILLAQEFLKWDGDEHTSLLKKAGKESQLTSSYPEVTQTADKLGIDQLALDDEIFMAGKEGVMVKMGKYLIWVKPQDSLPRLKYKGCNALVSRWASAEQFIAISPFGMAQRNKQWTRRLKAVEDNYDLILVYAGNGHIGADQPNNVQTLLNSEDFANIELIPTDLPENNDLYQARDKKGEKSGLTNDAKVYKEKENLSAKATKDTLWEKSAQQQIALIKQAIANWKNTKLPLWGVSTQEDFLKANPRLKDAFDPAHCSYVVIMQQPRTIEQQKPEVCPAPKTMPMGPKHKSYI